jgi:hypothetical protein
MRQCSSLNERNKVCVSKRKNECVDERVFLHALVEWSIVYLLKVICSSLLFSHGLLPLLNQEKCQ